MRQSDREGSQREQLYYKQVMDSNFLFLLAAAFRGDVRTKSDILRHKDVS